MAEKKAWIFLAVFTVFIVLLLPVHESEAAEKSSQWVSETGPWLRAGGHIWLGVKLFVGPGDTKYYRGEVLGGTAPFASWAGVKLRMKSGSIEWKSRDAIGTDSWFVKANDPALKAQKWKVLKAPK